MNKSSSYRDRLILAVIWIAGLAGLYLISLYNYLLFHSLAELFAVFIAFSVFIFSWNTRQLLRNDYLSFLGIGYMFVGTIDLIHALDYSGMGIFKDSSTNLPTQLWIAARYMESATLCLAPLFSHRRFNSRHVFTGYMAVTVLLLLSIYKWQIFPECFIEGSGLTVFKKTSEYIISVILVFSIILLHRRRDKFDQEVLHLLVAAISLGIASELTFTFYIHAYGFSNLLGHYFKIISYYLIYKAIIEAGQVRPLNQLFENLKQRESELEKANQQLKFEVSQRRHMQAELKESHNNLERIIAERTAELKNTYQQLLHAEKLSVVGTLSASIAHEFGSPIFGIRNFIDSLLKRLPLGQADAQLAELAIQECNRIKEMIDDLQNFNRPSSALMGPVDLHRIVDDMLLLCKKDFNDKKIVVEKDYAAELPEIIAIDDQIKQVVLNLLSNAEEAIPASGGIIRIRTRLQKDEVELSIQDSGSGIKPEHLEKIFEPFFTTKDKTHGTGLGLSVSYGIIKYHHGKIDVESRPEAGSTFTIKLPLKTKIY